VNKRARDVVRRTATGIGEHPRQVLFAVLGVAFILRLLWLWWPQDALIFDEAYYVNAARVIAGREVPAGMPYAGSEPGLDPNTPHPPLAKVLIAGSIAVLGDGGIGWRLPSVVAGMVGLIALYGIVRRSGGSAWLGILAVSLFALDNLAFVHARIGTLDMLALAPILVGAWFALSGRTALAGAACAFGTLAKLTGVFGLAAILVIQAIGLATTFRRERRLQLSDFRPMFVMVAVYAAATIGGLWVLDLRFSNYSDPISHLEHMVAYGASLQTTAPTGIASYPWQWLVNDVEINYLRIAVDTSADGSIVASEATVDFRGAMNPVLIGAAPLAFLLAAGLAVRTRNRVALWCLVWAATNYLPYYILVLVGQRITYLYYFLPTVPALAVAVTLLLTNVNLPRLAQAVFLVAVGWAYLAYFPFRELP
jgi:predicted membrane-bound dolichyl-phosphate-mannose-protein mannosyltransferase